MTGADELHLTGETTRLLEQATFEIKRVIVGQDRLVERMLVAFLAGGHCLIEGVPGVAKTLAAQTLATVVGVLIEVPVMLMLVRVCQRTQGWFRSEHQEGVRRVASGD